MIILHCSTWGRVAEATERNTLKWLLLLTGGWQVSLSLALLLWTYAYCQCMYVYVCLYTLCMGLCALREHVCVLYKHLCVCFCLQCVHLSWWGSVYVIWPVGIRISPAEFLTQSHHKSREDLHQTDYSTAAMTASNGRNKTPFNEDANLRNITLCSEI